MSYLPRRVRALAFAFAALALGFAAAPATQASSLALDYQCTYPLVADEPVSLELDAAIPETYLWLADGPYDARAKLTLGGDTWAGFKAVDVATIEGTAKVGFSLISGTGRRVSLPVEFALPRTPVADAPPPFSVRGLVPGLMSPLEGPGKLDLESLELRFTARDAAGAEIPLPAWGDDTTAASPFSVPCKRSPLTQDPTFMLFPAGHGDPLLLPFRTQVQSVTPTSATLTWTSADGFGTADRYDVFVDDVKVASVPAPGPRTYVLAGLTPKTGYHVWIEAIDGAARRRSPSVQVETSAGSATFTSTYGVAGAATLKKLAKGTVPLTGSAQLTGSLDAGSVSMALTLPPSTADLVVLGLFPVRAKVAFVPTGAAVGTLAPGALKLRLKARLKLPYISMMGIPLAVVSSCQTRSASTIDLQATEFTDAAGGTLVGAFTISDLVGCGVLTGLVSPLTAGGGNVMALSLTPTG